MAKESAPAAPAPSSTPAPAKFMGANAVEGVSAEVVKWGNGEAVSTHDVPIVDGLAEKPAVEAPAETEAPKTEDKPAEEASAEEKPAEEVKAKAAVDPERRKQIMESLAAERAKRSMEKQIEDAKKAAETAKTAQEAFDKLPLARKLALVAEKHGMTVEDLKDRMLIGADDVADTAPKPVDPTVAALQETVKQLQERLSKQDEQTQQQQVQRAVAQVKENLKETDLPLVDTFDAYGRVLATAHEAWMAAGRAGAVADFLPEAAVIVEDELKAEKPHVAARLYPKAKTEGEAEEKPEMVQAQVPKPRISAGKRTASRPEAKPKSLWEGGKTAAEVDAQIKKDLGWA